MTVKRLPLPKTTRPCVICGGPVTGRLDVETCSSACRQKRYRQRKGERAAPKPLLINPHAYNAPPKVKALVLARDAYACTYCGATEQLEVDHVIPVSEGGLTTLDNLTTACRTCNKKKGPWHAYR